MWQLNGEKDPKLVYGKGNQYKKKEYKSMLITRKTS